MNFNFFFKHKNMFDKTCRLFGYWESAAFARKHIAFLSLRGRRGVGSYYRCLVNVSSCPLADEAVLTCCILREATLKRILYALDIIRLGMSTLSLISNSKIGLYFSA